MSETVYKPTLGDSIIGALVSLVAAFTFSPVVVLVVFLIDTTVGLSMGGFLLLTVIGCLLSSVLMFIALWCNSVSKRNTVDEP